MLSAGLTDICKSIGEGIPFRMTPSANQNNGPRQLRTGQYALHIYTNGYGML